MKKIVSAALLLGLTACAEVPPQAPANQLAFNDFEGLDGWTGDLALPSLTKEHAHSGAYAVRVADGLEFSLGYRTVLRKLGDNKLRKIKVQAWVYVPSPKASCMLVTEVRNKGEDKTALWDGIRLTDVAKVQNRWVRVEKEIVLPATATPESQLQVYLWRSTSPQPTYLDDLRISRVE